MSGFLGLEAGSSNAGKFMTPRNTNLAKRELAAAALLSLKGFQSTAFVMRLRYLAARDPCHEDVSKWGLMVIGDESSLLSAADKKRFRDRILELAKA